MPRATSRTATAAPDRTPGLRGVSSLSLLGTLARPVVIESMRDVLHGAAPEEEQTDKYDRVGSPLSEATSR